MVFPSTLTYFSWSPQWAAPPEESKKPHIPSELRVRPAVLGPFIFTAFLQKRSLPQRNTHSNRHFSIKCSTKRRVRKVLSLRRPEVLSVQNAAIFSYFFPSESTASLVCAFRQNELQQSSRALATQKLERRGSILRS